MPNFSQARKRLSASEAPDTTIGLPERRPAGRFDPQRIISEGGGALGTGNAFSEDPNVQAANIAKAPFRGLSEQFQPPPDAASPDFLLQSGADGGSMEIEDLLKRIFG